MELLSPEWCARLVELCARRTADLRDVTIQVQLTGAPRGKGQVAVVIDGGLVTECVAERRADAVMTLKSSWADVQSMLGGELDPNVAFMTGDLKTDGPTGPLLALLAAWRRPNVVAAREQLAGETDTPD